MGAGLAAYGLQRSVLYNLCFHAKEVGRIHVSHGDVEVKPYKLVLFFRLFCNYKGY